MCVVDTKWGLEKGTIGVTRHQNLGLGPEPATELQTIRIREVLVVACLVYGERGVVISLCSSIFWLS